MTWRRWWARLPARVAPAWLLQRAPNVLAIPGTSKVAHLEENLGAAELRLSEDVLVKLDGIAGEGKA